MNKEKLSINILLNFFFIFWAFREQVHIIQVNTASITEAQHQKQTLVSTFLVMQLYLVFSELTKRFQRQIFKS